jgi:hypothetical protein
MATSAFLLAVGVATADDKPPPPPADVAFARQLWQQMAWAGLVGDNAVRSAPFKGGGTHTAIIEYLAQNVRVGHLSGLVLIKKNNDGDDVSIERVWDDPKKYLSSITIMFRRRGYDPQNADWFWAEYAPNGTVDYAGKVEHCIVCHKAGRRDYRFLPEQRVR